MRHFIFADAGKERVSATIFSISLMWQISVDNFEMKSRCLNCRGEHLSVFDQVHKSWASDLCKDKIVYLLTEAKALDESVIS